MSHGTIEDTADELHLDATSIRHLQDEALVRVVRDVAHRSPYYQRRLAEAGITPASVRSMADLPALPLTSKTDIAEAGTDLWCLPHDAVTDVSTTSGTTGEPTLYPLTEGDISRLGRNEELSFRCAGLTQQDRVLLAVTMDRCFIAGLAYFEGLRRLGATTMRVGSGSPAMVLEMMDRLRPTVLVSVPSFLKRVAEAAQERGIHLADRRVGKLVCIGEPIRGENLALNPLGERLAHSWGAAVLSTYGVTELATSACECPSGAGAHIHPELLAVEILDEEGRPLPPGSVGEVVATTFRVEAMPLLRFRTGDCSFLMTERCSCGRWTPRLGPILGRKNQMMKIRGTTLFPGSVRRVLDSLDFVQGYVMIVTAPAPLSDELEVVASVHGAPSDPARRIAEALQGLLRVKPVVRIAPSEEIERLQFEKGLRKRQDFLDHR